MVSDDVRRDGSSDQPDPTSDRCPRGGSPGQGDDVTQILSAIEHGDGQAAEELLPLVYNELRKLAADKMANEKPAQTLQATALVHEAYIRLVDVKRVQHWDSRGHFFSAAAEAMRRILVDRARHKETLRAGGDAQRIDLDNVDPAIEGPKLDLLALEESLQRLESRDPRRANLVKLRFFAGLSIPAAAEALGISVPTADADWSYAKSWLRVDMSRQGTS